MDYLEAKVEDGFFAIWPKKQHFGIAVRRDGSIATDDIEMTAYGVSMAFIYCVSKHDSHALRSYS